jgi:hypothetical protein
MKNINKIENISETKKEIIVQSIFFSCFVLLFWYLYAYKSITDFKSFVNVFLYASTYNVILLFNIHYLYKNLFLKRKYGLYFFITVFSFLFGYLAQQFIYSENLKELFLSFQNNYKLYIIDWFINILTFTMFGGVGLAFKIILLWSKTQKHLVSLQNENLKIELQNLKSQVSPHFLFNTLNSLYVLTKTKPEKASDSILNLSDLLRYQINAVSLGTVKIQDEIDYMKNLLNLEQLRRDDLQINFDLNILDPNYQIQPLLFSPLLENSIKHGSQKLNRCRIDICIKVNNNLYFEIKNSIPKAITNDYEVGTGLTNLRRRLEICYQERYTLNLEKKDDSFSAILTLE